MTRITIDLSNKENESLLRALLDKLNIKYSVQSGASKQQKQKMLDALQKIADKGGIKNIKDPAKWQKQTRSDRPLPGRE